MNINNFLGKIIVMTALLLMGAKLPSGWTQIPRLPGGFAVDTANKDLIRLISSEVGTFILENDITLNVLVGTVIFEHKGDRLYADSARLDITRNIVHAYGNIKVEQTDGTVAYADRMYYDGNTKNVELVGNVELNSGADYLWSDKIDYNLGSQIGKYNNHGTLQSGATVIESKTAIYYGKTNDARFKGDVNVLDPEYEVVSADLGYNTDTRVVTFFGPSIINNDSSTLFTTKGTYDSEAEIAIFRERSSIQSESQYMEADSMYYNRKTGLGIGTGDVVVIDSTREITLYCQFSTVNELTKQVMATVQPYAVMIREQDTTYVKADTFFTEPVANLTRIFTPRNAQDSLLQALDILYRELDKGTLLDSNTVRELDSLHQQIEQEDTLLDAAMFDFRNNTTTDTLQQPAVDTLPEVNEATGPENDVGTVDSLFIPPIVPDSAAQMTRPETGAEDLMFSEDSLFVADSVNTDTDPLLGEDEDLLAYGNDREEEDPRYFNAYRNVVVYNDSFQARADSMFYSQEDSIMQFHIKPVLWSRNGQITGEVILAMVDTQHLRWVKIPKNGIIVNQSTEANEVMFDQIQGNTIWAYFTENEMDSIVALGNAQTIYFIKDEYDAYVGVSEADAADLKIEFYTDSSGQRAIRNITYYKENNQKTTPMRMSQPDKLRLSRFIWRKEERVNSLDEFFRLVYGKQENAGEKPLLKDEIQEKLIKMEE